MKYFISLICLIMSSKLDCQVLVSLSSNKDFGFYQLASTESQFMIYDFNKEKVLLTSTEKELSSDVIWLGESTCFTLIEKKNQIVVYKLNLKTLEFT